MQIVKVAAFTASFKVRKYFIKLNFFEVNVITKQSNKLQLNAKSIQLQGVGSFISILGGILNQYRLAFNPAGKRIYLDGFNNDIGA